MLIGQAYGVNDVERIRAVAGATLNVALIPGMLVGLPAVFHRLTTLGLTGARVVLTSIYRR